MLVHLNILECRVDRRPDAGPLRRRAVVDAHRRRAAPVPPAALGPLLEAHLAALRAARLLARGALPAAGTRPCCWRASRSARGPGTSRTTTGIVSSTGRVMLSVLPIVIGFQLILQAILLDIHSSPTMIARRAPPSSSSTTTAATSSRTRCARRSPRPRGARRRAAFPVVVVDNASTRRLARAARALRRADHADRVADEHRLRRRQQPRLRALPRRRDLRAAQP